MAHALLQKISLIKIIQEADRGAGFKIGGIDQHVITFMMEERRENRRKRNSERIGIAAQRFSENKMIQ